MKGRRDEKAASLASRQTNNNKIPPTPKHPKVVSTGAERTSGPSESARRGGAFDPLGVRLWATDPLPSAGVGRRRRGGRIKMGVKQQILKREH